MLREPWHALFGAANRTDAIIMWSAWLLIVLGLAIAIAYWQPVLEEYGQAEHTGELEAER